MADTELEQNGAGSNWKTKAFLVGGVVGALLGVGAAYLYVSNVEESGEEPGVSPRDAVTVGVTVIGLLRQIANLGD
ncbi:MAG: hypothetical protein ACE5FI_16960 [Anaerolineales bacterium]